MNWSSMIDKNSVILKVILSNFVFNFQIELPISISKLLKICIWYYIFFYPTSRFNGLYWSPSVWAISVLSSPKKKEKKITCLMNKNFMILKVTPSNFVYFIGCKLVWFRSCSFGNAASFSGLQQVDDHQGWVFHEFVCRGSEKFRGLRLQASHGGHLENFSPWRRRLTRRIDGIITGICFLLEA